VEWKVMKEDKVRVPFLWAKPPEIRMLAVIDKKEKRTVKAYLVTAFDRDQHITSQVLTFDAEVALTAYHDYDKLGYAQLQCCERDESGAERMYTLFSPQFQGYTY
jgi:hypothetical protein